MLTTWPNHGGYNWIDYCLSRGHGGGQMVSIGAFHSKDSSSYASDMKNILLIHCTKRRKLIKRCRSRPNFNYVLSVLIKWSGHFHRKYVNFNHPHLPNHFYRDIEPNLRSLQNLVERRNQSQPALGFFTGNEQIQVQNGHLHLGQTGEPNGSSFPGLRRWKLSVRVPWSQEHQGQMFRHNQCR